MEVTRLFDLLENGKKVYSANPALGCKQNGQWITYGISEFIDYANNLSYGFLAMGLNKGDKVITVTNNRPEWNFVDMGLNLSLIHI